MRNNPYRKTPFRCYVCNRAVVGVPPPRSTDLSGASNLSLKINSKSSASRSCKDCAHRWDKKKKVNGHREKKKKKRKYIKADLTPASAEGVCNDELWNYGSVHGCPPPQGPPSGTPLGARHHPQAPTPAGRPGRREGAEAEPGPRPRPRLTAQRPPPALASAPFECGGRAGIGPAPPFRRREEREGLPQEHGRCRRLTERLCVWMPSTLCLASTSLLKILAPARGGGFKTKQTRNKTSHEAFKDQLDTKVILSHRCPLAKQQTDNT